MAKSKKGKKSYEVGVRLEGSKKNISKKQWKQKQNKR